MFFPGKVRCVNECISNCRSEEEKKPETGLQGKRSGDCDKKRKKSKTPSFLQKRHPSREEREKREWQSLRRGRKKWQNGSSKGEEEEKQAKPNAGLTDLGRTEGASLFLCSFLYLICLFIAKTTSTLFLLFEGRKRRR